MADMELGQPVQDVAIGTAARKMEHYEIACYESAISIAEQLGLQDVVQPLRQSLEEERRADQPIGGGGAHIDSKPSADGDGIVARVSSFSWFRDRPRFRDGDIFVGRSHNVKVVRAESRRFGRGNRRHATSAGHCPRRSRFEWQGSAFGFL